MLDLSCALSGHRQIFRIHEEKLPALLSSTIDSLIESGVKHFLSGGALGFDMLAAEIIIEKKRHGADIRLSMFLPCRNQADRWSASSRKRYADILDSADEVIYVSEKYDQFCMKARNRRLIDEADLLLCYLALKSGGTAYTADYAAQKGRKIVNLANLL